jgi:hypothetical protein
MDSRVSIKFENAQYEQTYKLGSDDRLDNLEALERFVRDGLLREVETIFRFMHQNRLQAGSTCFPPDDSAAFDTII